MQLDLRSAMLPLALEIIAFWPVWPWFFRRAEDLSDESWGWLALVTAVLLLIRDRQAIRTRLIFPALCLFVYAFSYQSLPPLARAMIALTAIGATFAGAPVIVTGLLWLSLPVIASLQFFLGYPLRLLIAGLSAPWLRLGGLSVEREGAYLVWGEKMILVDAPCSGVKMLWMGIYLSLALAGYYRLGWRRTTGAVLLSVSAVLVGNLLRSVALFYVESGLVELPAWGHSGIGLAVFFATALGIGWLTKRMGGGCAASLSL